MPSSTPKQRRFMGAALSRKRAGKPAKDDPKLSTESLAEFASGPVRAKGNPMRFIGSMCFQAHHE